MKIVLLDARPFVGGADLTSSSNKVELSVELEEKDATTFGSGKAKEVLGGLSSAAVSASGLWEAGDPGKIDDTAWAQLKGRAHAPWTICPVAAGAGDLAYAVSGLTTSYKLGGQVGDAAPWEAQASGSGIAARGQISAELLPRTASGSGAPIQLGPLAFGQQMLATLHVLSAAGTTPSLTVLVESSPDNTFAAPTTRATFAPATTAGGWSTVATGAVADPWWRISWTITGTTPSFLFLAALGL